LNAFADSVDSLDSAPVSAPLRDLIQTIRQAVQAQNADHPATQAVTILKESVPRILVFSEADRSLQPSYDLGTEDPFPPALSNLARLANLDLPRLREAISAENHAAVETLIQAANSHLKQIFQVSWSQSGVSVHFRVDTNTLHVLVEGGDKAYTSIAERSDGLRHFVALLSFVTLRDPSAVKPILLIDELESHLHYDAQADLVQMLVRQEVAAKVVYTTHSFGCLPEDLGTGVRTVEPVKSKPDTSRVNNWFWESDGLGFEPVLFGMGASATAFIPIRKALFAEGPSDFVLLPSMFREAAGRSHLGFQIVPGLSTISRDHAPLLEGRAAKVAFLVDADSGGDEIQAKLKRAGFPQRLIFKLPDPSNEGLVLEDFVHQEVYAIAVSECLRRRYGQKRVAPQPDLKPPNRPARLKDWCSANGLEPPGRRAVAYQILQARGIGSILDPAKRTTLAKLYKEVCSALGLPAR
jgi:hypothetical protein